MSINQQQVTDSISTSNSSTANLASAASFTGTEDSLNGISTIKITFNADQNCTIQVQQSENGTNWDISDSYTTTASTGDARVFQAVASYVRIVATNNGGSATTFLRLQTDLSPVVQEAPRSLSQAGNFKVAIEESIPAGSNTIGGVTQSSPPWSVVGNVASGSTDSGDPVKIGGVYNSTLPSPSTGQRVDMQVDYKGRVLVAPASLSYFHPIYTTRVQVASNSNSTNTLTLTATIKSTQSGNLIVVCATSLAGTLTCTDSASQTYTTAVTVNNGGGNPTYNYTFYKANTAAGVTSVTITDGTSTALNMIVCEYTDISATPLDKTQSNSGAASTSFTSNSTTTTSQANELLIGCTLDTAHNNTTFTVGTNWGSVVTTQNGAGNGGSLFLQEQYVQATGAYASTGTMSQSDAYLATIATFEISAYPSNFVVPNSAFVIKNGPGTFANVAISTLGTGSASVTFYDGTSASGTVIATLSLTTSIGSVSYNVHFVNGLTMVVSSKTADFTVTYD